MRSIPPTATGPGRLPAWSVAEGPFGIRLLDVGIVALVIVAIEVNVIVGTGPGAVPLNIWAYLDGALLAVPILFRHRWPFRVMIASAVLIFLYYIFARRNISPAPVFFVPLYDATVAGYLIWAVAIAAGFMITGLVVVEASTGEGLATLFSDFLSQIVILALAVTVGEVVRSRQALAAETARRLRLAEEERAAESGRVVAEERLRIARELHDTVAHSMATITVQAGSALHVLGRGTITNKPPDDPGLGAPAPSSGPRAESDKLRAALIAIRETSKGALTEMRSVLGQLRRSDPRDPGLPDDAGPPGADAAGQTGLARLPALKDAVTAAGATVTVTVEGERRALSAQTDHSAYRILQESLTNVLRHAAPGAVATVCLRYQPDVLTITVTDSGRPQASGPDGPGGPRGPGGPQGSAGDVSPPESGPGGHGGPGSPPVSGGPGGYGGAGSPPVSGGSRGVVPPDGTSHGIRGMRERAASVGGELTAGPLPGGGFQVRATLPTATQATAGQAARQAGDVPGARGESS